MPALQDYHGNICAKILEECQEHQVLHNSFWMNKQKTSKTPDCSLCLVTKSDTSSITLQSSSSSVSFSSHQMEDHPFLHRFGLFCTTLMSPSLIPMSRAPHLPSKGNPAQSPHKQPEEWKGLCTLGRAFSGERWRWRINILIFSPRPTDQIQSMQLLERWT